MSSSVSCFEWTPRCTFPLNQPIITLLVYFSLYLLSPPIKSHQSHQVDLSHNRIGLAGAFSVVRLLVSPESSISHSLTRLSLAHCFLTDAAAEALGTCLRENPTLAVLDLSTNAIGDKGRWPYSVIRLRDLYCRFSAVE